MGYWESTEYYPDNKPEVWNSSSQCWTAINPTNTLYYLCGKPIRHHKFPDNITNNSLLTNHFYTDPATKQTTIRILGVEFDNIICPKDNEGNDIPGIVGYEILRGSREGNKTIIAKGMLNNLRPYNVKGPGNANRKGLYPNYPFNTIVPLNPSSGGNLNTGSQANDPYIKVTDDDDDRVNVTKNDIPTFLNTFHSPDTNFRNPFLDFVELKLYGVLTGLSDQYFIEPDQHPKNKLISNNTIGVMILAGALEAILSLGGDVSFTQPGGQFQQYYGIPSLQGTVVFGTPAYNATFATLDYADYLLGQAFYTGATSAYFTSGAGILDSATGYSGLNAIYQNYMNAGNVYTAPTVSFQNSTSRLLGIATAITQTFYYFSQGAELALRTIYAIIPYRQYALQMLAHGYYSDFSALVQTQLYRFKIGDDLYLNDNIQDLKPWNNNFYRVNNLKRQRTVLLRTTSGAGLDTGPYFITGSGSTGYYDQSLLTIGTARNNGLGKVEFNETNKTSVFNARIASHYGAVKVRIRNQYGQLDSIKQIPITPCEQKVNLSAIKPKKTGKYCTQIQCDGTRTQVEVLHKIISTPILFNGDTYVNRYTEKNNMFFMNQDFG
jgi:hypothetical protein